MPVDPNQAQEAIQKIDELVARTEALEDPAVKEIAVDLVGAVMELHAAALSRMLEIVSGREDGGAETLGAMASDDLVSSVLVLHGLHPHDVETRVRRAFEKLRMHFDSRGSGIELISLNSDSVRLRFTGKRPGSGPAARQIIESAVYEAAPEIREIAIEGVDESSQEGFVPLANLVNSQ